ncbi:hypothetical protein [Zooshikella harenae]|uniref:Zinc ribbon domain-containing protein n=1 Tax=Zooshikella harenae TaxID=2827238 RepID=A0ABS5ZIB0_9GAMM|nr:hypothetical protein [Zooshikella harenae]MBU2713593.1 hypothetical protein [Zooshikella harenae]
MSCNHKNEAYARFCTVCGIKLDRQFCCCGVANYCNALFCWRCGQRLVNQYTTILDEDPVTVKYALIDFLDDQEIQISINDMDDKTVSQDDIEALFNKGNGI